MPDKNGLVTATVLNRKISEVDNEILSVSVFVKKIDYDAKIKEIEGKYFTTTDYNKFTSDILDVKIKQKDSVNKSNSDKKLININEKTSSKKTKHKETDKKLTDLTKKLHKFKKMWYDFLLGRKYFTGDDGYQRFLDFVSTLSSLILNSKKKVTKWISTGISFQKIKPFDAGPEPTMSNLANVRVNLKLDNSVFIAKKKIFIV